MEARLPADYLMHGVIIHIGMDIEGKGQSHNIAYVKDVNTCGGNCLFDVRYVMGLAFPFNARVNVDDKWEYDDAKTTLVWAVNERGMLPCCKQQCAKLCASMAAAC